MKNAKTISWKNHTLFLLDQLQLPAAVRFVRCRSYRQVADAIRRMAVRGAPAIGVAAAFGVALAAREKAFRSPREQRRSLKNAIRVLAATRPTAVNLFWALERMKGVIASLPGAPVRALAGRLEAEAKAVYREDVEMNRKIGANGARLLRKKCAVLTHCNAGALATSEYGTALGVVRAAHRQGKVRMVFVDETRPYLQGARLTAWEMSREGIPHVLITDNMAGHFMKTERIGAVIVGADRIAANGDTANKIGTYSLAILAKHHRIPFYVAAPGSTVDIATPDGKAVTIEERSSDEVVRIGGRLIAPKGTRARHPAFDVTPAKLITAIITERGVFKPGDIRRSVERNTRG